MMQPPSSSPESPSSSAFALREWFKNLAAGTMAGVVSKGVEHPFDTVKVRIQSQPFRYKGAIDCAATMWRTEGVSSFFRGLPSPLVGCMFENALVFSTYGEVRRLLQRKVPAASGEMTEIALAGAAAGMMSTLINTPIELIKCRMQAQPHLYSNSFDCLRKTIRTEGLRGLTRGFLATFGREIPGTAVWFLTYERVLKFSTLPGGTKKDLSLGYHLVAGAFAGVMYWVVPFPFDVIKSKVQTYSAGMSYRHVVDEIFRSQGVRGFYKGLGVTMMRAMPTNAVIFTAYEFFHRQLTKFV